MEPRNWDGPSIDIAVLSRLKRLDPQLVVTWTPFALDPLTSNPIEGSGRLDPHTGEYVLGPVDDPAFYLWRKDENSTHHVHVNCYQRFGHREVLSLERDIARFERPQDIMRIFTERDEVRRAKRRELKEQVQRDKIVANQSRIHDLVFEGKGTNRMANPFSYPGQKNRSTPGDIELRGKEAGFEVSEEE